MLPSIVTDQVIHPQNALAASGLGAEPHPTVVLYNCWAVLGIRPNRKWPAGEGLSTGSKSLGIDEGVRRLPWQLRWAAGSLMSEAGVYCCRASLHHS